MKVLEFIAKEGGASTLPGAPYLSRYPENDYNVSIRFIICHHVFDSYFSACNALDNIIRMRHHHMELDKYWVPQSGYFRLDTTVALGMGIIDRKLLFYHDISEKIKDKTISMIY